MFKPNRPNSCICATSACGYSLRCSMSEATGMTSLATNFRTVPTISSCSLFIARTRLLLGPERHNNTALHTQYVLAALVDPAAFDGDDAALVRQYLFRDYLRLGIDGVAVKDRPQMTDI